MKNLKLSVSDFMLKGYGFSADSSHFSVFSFSNVVKRSYQDKTIDLGFIQSQVRAVVGPQGVFYPAPSSVILTS